MLRIGTSGDTINILEAISRSQAVIEFDLKGNILTANENFCRALSYSLQEIIGRHHKMFCEPQVADSAEYREFWERLGTGAFDAGTYKRIAKGGRQIWIQASYNPVLRKGAPYKVVKFAADITAATERAIEDAGKLSALSRSQAVIEFTPAGEIITANENFCRAMGYALEEIIGRHHRIFCKAEYVASSEYEGFWHRLAGGEFIANEFVRMDKSGREIWIQAAYNPILDSSGRVTKVVKLATDVTERMSAIASVNSGLEALAGGDLRRPLNEPFVPSMEGLRANFNSALARLDETMRHIGESAVAIAEGSGEISGTTDSFSKRTEQQAASVEETAAALEEITTTVSDSSNRAHEAGQLVRQTKENAEHSGRVVRDAVDAMSKIEASATEIGNIIGVIDEIAFQTNLLALNAGVEAARAGDAGKGFAVVAQEVRELAQRSAQAAKEIKDLIHTSNDHVRSGVALVGETGKALEQIVIQVQQVDGNVGAIVESSKEQASGLKEINSSVNAMDQGTQQNAAMVEQATAAAHSLASESNALFQLLSQFNIGSDGGSVRHHGSPATGSYRKTAMAG